MIHRIHNRSLFPLEFAPWALTMMAPGGTAITGFPPRGKHPQVLAATNPLVMWAYTDLSDPRWRFTKKYMSLRQDPKAGEPQKLGHFNPKTVGCLPASRRTIPEADRSGSLEELSRFRLFVRDFYECGLPGNGNAGTDD